MQDIATQGFYKLVHRHLETNYQYDFIHEVIEVLEGADQSGGTYTVVGYRGANGEYGSVHVDVPVVDFLQEIL